MIGRLTGIVIEKTPQGKLLIDVNGVGYRVEVPLSTLSLLSDYPLQLDPLTINTQQTVAFKVSLLIHQVIREDSVSLFGFLTQTELDIFSLLIKVSGIGPKTAIIILSGLSPDDLCNVIYTSDYIRLSKVPGIGKKTAERLVLELKDKLPQVVNQSKQSSLVQHEFKPNVEKDAVLALVSLGYKMADAEKMIKKVNTVDQGVDDLIKQALQNALK